MIGSTTFSTVFGAAPAGDTEGFASIVKAAIRHGYSPVLLQPGGKEPGCILSPRTATAADKARMDELAAGGAQRITNVRHECGFKHVLDDPAKVGPIVARFGERYGTPINLGLHLGRSRLIAVDVDTPTERIAFTDWLVSQGLDAPGITQESPGFYDTKSQTWKHWGGGHWIFTVPDEWAFPTTGKVVKGPGGFAVMYGESYILVPPSVRPEGPYRLTGSAGPAPAALLDFITAGAAAAERERTEFVLDHDDPIEQWSAYWSWDQILEPDGWTNSYGRSDCGCPEWTAPGDHASPKSATAHEVGCTRLDTSTGWGPLHLWTDHPPEPLQGSTGTMTKLDYVSRMHYGGDVKAAMVAQQLVMEQVVPQLKAFTDADPFGRPGGAVTHSTPAGGQVALPSSPYAPPSRTLIWTQASTITVRATRWLWEEDGSKWISLGGLWLLSGREGVGKSTWAYRIAASISRGVLKGAFFGVPRSVVVAATEDAWEQTIAPRLLAAGADMALIWRIDVQLPDRQTGLTLPTDINALAHGAVERGVGLILLDPLMGTISSSLDSHKDAEVRQALEPISRLAGALQITVIGLIHQNKSGKGDLLQQLMASVAFSAVARGVLVCARDTEAVDPDSGEPASGHYVFGQAKSNLGPEAESSIRYRIESAHVGHDAELNEPVWSSRIVDMGATGEQIRDIVARQQHPNREAPAVKGAEEWLRGNLDLKGAVPKADVIQEGAAAGHSSRTLERAALRIGVVSQRDGSLPGSPATWSITSL